MSIISDALHTKPKSGDFALTDKIHSENASFNGHAAIAISRLPIAPMVARIVGGMHALLYKDFLPIATKNKFHIPLPEGDTETHRWHPPLEQSFAFSKVVRKALLTETADVVRAYNDKFKYACIWVESDEGVPFCVTCFDIYAFHVLSPPVSNFPQTFVGMYSPDRVPEGAGRASRLDVSLTNEECLNPWQ